MPFAPDPELRSMMRLGRPVASAAAMRAGANALTMSATPRTFAPTTPARLSGSASQSGPSVDSMRPALLTSTCSRCPVSASSPVTAALSSATDAASSTVSPKPVAFPPVSPAISAAASRALTAEVAVTTTR
ncbi:Uncharacterised protein [Mycobacteroides abscessus subsp. abscessus]|nr:Uncharacterised protein [Mycobacteroides abscessus subsp. abscessus]